MKISEQWLREWVSPEVTTEELGHQLTMAGLEVDGIEPLQPAPDNVVVGRVTAINPHPNADKLRITTVDVGQDSPLQIVCGASNVREGGVYPVAMIGAVLPGGLKIKKSKLRGEESFGMLCSASELALEESSEGLYELDPNRQPGTLISDVINFDDAVIDIDLTPNRADCFSIRGVAREVAAANELTLPENVISQVDAAIDDALSVSLEADKAGPLFAGRIVKGINSQASTPVWMREKLRRGGVRPIHPVVDVTNFVMLELGQPMHGYDLAKLDGGLSVRFARDKEKLVLLGGQELELSGSDLVIADSNGAVALAGVMGGDPTSVTDDTVDVVLEAAFFDPDAVAGKAREYGLHTDSSLRFERGVDFDNTVAALERATALLQEIAGGQAGPVTVECKNDLLPKRAPIELRHTRLNSLLGIDVPGEQVVAMFAQLDMQVETTDAGWLVTPPGARFDIEIEEDLIEEVVRLIGYDNIPDIPAPAPMTLATSSEYKLSIDRIRSSFVDQGYQEAVTYSFVDPETEAMLCTGDEPIVLQNPISLAQSVMRRSLWPGLVQALKLNESRQENRVRLFEYGVRFTSRGGEITEEDVFAGIISGNFYQEHWEGKQAGMDIFDIKSDIYANFMLTNAHAEFRFDGAEHPVLRPGRTARIERNGQLIGWMGELHPALVAKLGLSTAPLLFEYLAEPALEREPVSYQAISKFPQVRRDLAVVVDEDLPVSDLVREVAERGGPLLREVVVFDIYAGESVDSGRKSVALGLILQEKSRTLNDTEVDGVVDTVTQALADKFAATIRD